MAASPTDWIQYQDESFTKGNATRYYGTPRCSNQQDLKEIKVVDGKIANEPLLLTGPIGSGKSTFMKYQLVVNSEIFNKNLIIPSRIEFERLEQYLIDHDQRLWGDIQRKYIIYCMARDVIYYVSLKGWGLSKSRTNHAFVFFRSELKKFIKNYRIDNIKGSKELFDARLSTNTNLNIVDNVLKYMSKKLPSFNTIWR